METSKKKSRKTPPGKNRRKQGTLIIVGGAEDKSKEKIILREIASRTGAGKLVVSTAASQVAEEMWQEYRSIFKSLGVKNIQHLFIQQPEDARHPGLAEIFENANTIFFTGGDQLKITTKLGGTTIVDWIYKLYTSGGTIAGTSAGASVMGKTMLVGGENAESHKVGNWMMAPGLGLAEEMIIDQHFAQRGRIGRLLGAVALNPGILGIGIDEDTSIIVEGDHFTVLGSNAVYVIDGREVTYTNISEATPDRTMSMHDVRLHILAEGEIFDFKARKVKAVASN
jgi:cyanophycinase